MSKRKSRKRVKKYNVKPLVLLALGATILTVIAVVIFITSPSNPLDKGIPLYVSTSIYGHINFENNNEYVQVLLSYANCTNGLCIIMFGSQGCPHCHAMHEFFMGNPKYRDIFKVLWIETDEQANKLFYDLSQIEKASGINIRIAYSVPHILVVKNNSIYAIVVGEAKDQDFWNKLLSLN